jgi:hypothetical protein
MLGEDVVEHLHDVCAGEQSLQVLAVEERPGIQFRDLAVPRRIVVAGVHDHLSGQLRDRHSRISPHWNRNQHDVARRGCLFGSRRTRSRP